MDKVLTISIAAYNSEQYIQKALDSLITTEIIDDLEIFVIDDGGTDATLRIAQTYAERYPQSIFPVHKENGGYGSTVNYSLDHASGKYFKLLDGDDWFAVDNLCEYVRTLKTVDTDIIITPFMKYVEGGESRLVNSVEGYVLDQDLDISGLEFRKVFGMWAITYKTELVKKSNLQLPLHCLYTDQIYSTVPFAYANTIRFVDKHVYCYRLGRDGQSVSKESRIKHSKSHLLMEELLCVFYEEQKEKGCRNLAYILRRISSYSFQSFKTFLLEPMSDEVMERIKDHDLKLKFISKDVYRNISNVKRFRKTALLLRMFRFLRYSHVACMISKLVLPKDGMEGWS